MNVRALVRNTSKAEAVLPTTHPDLSLFECDLADTTDAIVNEACASAYGLVWCASGFTSEGESLDLKGMAEFTQGLKEAGRSDARLVMLSSAGVTRTEWEDKKKEALVGASDASAGESNCDGAWVAGHTPVCAASLLERASTFPPRPPQARH